MHRRGAVDRYLAAGLPPAAEARLRRHLAGCPACRGYYDEQLALHRALAGAPDQPTRAELARASARALAGAGLARPAPPRPSPLEALLFEPWRAGLVAALLLAVLGGALAARGVDRGWLAAPRGAALAGRLVGGRGVTANGYELPPGSSVYAGTPLQVGPGGVAEVELVRGGRARLFPGAAASFAPGGERVELASGRVWCEVDKGKGPFAVRTDGAEARVLGTSFVVEREGDGDTEVRVMGGEVEVEDGARRGAVRVRGGQQTHVRRGAAPGPARTYSADADRLDWERFLESLGGELDRRLNRAGKTLDRLFGR